MLSKLLIVDDEENLVESISRLFMDDDIELFKASNGKEGLQQVMSHDPETIVVDYKMPEMDGLAFIKAVKSIKPEIPVIIMTAHGDKQTSVEFLKEGAYRYLEKPIRPDEFRHVVKDSLDRYQLMQENKKLETVVSLTNEPVPFIGKSEPIETLSKLIDRVAKTDITVLIQGESGTGKELVAHEIHAKSERSGKPFIRFNCAALPETLIESELFGHEKGAFTGADNQKMGRFELAQNGTIFFDEIGELSLVMQVKLLRFLQEREFERVGGTATIRSNVRVIAATNQNLEEMMSAKAFRDDLFYRLNSFPLTVPPLRERGNDIILLAEHYLDRFSSEFKIPVKGFSERTKELLKTYSWKGNVRELQNVISRGVILSSGGLITESNLQLTPESENGLLGEALSESLTEDDLVKRYAKAIYKRHGGNKKETAKALGINYRTLMSRLS